jgi:Ca-activated chloride channel family protein
METLIRMAGTIFLSLSLTFSFLPTGVCLTSNASEEPHPQQVSPASGFTIRSLTSLVTVDTVVRTNAGGFAGDLQSEDFAVYDDGVAQYITLFSREQLPLAVALVVDRSPSVQPYLAQLRSAALTTLERLKPDDEIALFSFDMNPAQFSELTTDRQRIAQMIGSIPRGILTNIHDALFDAASYLRMKAPDRRRAIILISDNYQTCNGAHSDRETLQEMLEGAVALYSIKTQGDNPGTSKSGGPADIARFARQTGGEVLNADTVNKLIGALDTALLNLKSGYVLGFTPSDIGKDGSYHRLDVRLKKPERCPKCRVQARTGYYAGAQPLAAARSAFRGTIKPRIAGMREPIDIEDLVARQRISAARDHPAELRDISFEVGVTRVSDARGKPQVKVNLKIDAANVLFKIVGDRHVGRLYVTAFWMDSKGTSLGAETKIIDLNLIASTYQRIQESGIDFDTTVPFRIPGQKLKMVVYDPWSSRLGSRVLRVE